MKRSAFLLIALCGAFLIGSVGGQPPAAAPPLPAGHSIQPAPNVKGGKVRLVPRDQLRVGPSVKTARLHPQTRAGLASGAIPVPATWDWTKGDTISMPLLGNDQYGDCYYCAPCHIIQAMTGMNGVTTTFTTADVVRRYLQLSPGDNGLSDGDVFPEFRKGIVGPNGPHKALDVLVVSSTDTAIQNLTSWAFGPQMFTFLVYSNFMNVGPGTVLTGNTGSVVGGHAVTMNGRDGSGRWRLQTWGIHPSVLATDAWVHGVQPEFVAVFSLEWFNAKGYAPNGQHYNTLAPLWNSMGGSVPTTGPFPPPGNDPPQPPLPPAPPTPPASTVWVGPDQDVRMLLYGPDGKVAFTTQLVRGSIVMHPQAVSPPKTEFTDAEVIAAAVKHAGLKADVTAISPAKLMQILAVIAADRAAGKGFLQTVLDVAVVLAAP